MNYILENSHLLISDEYFPNLMIKSNNLIEKAHTSFTKKFDIKYGKKQTFYYFVQNSKELKTLLIQIFNNEMQLENATTFLGTKAKQIFN